MTKKILVIEDNQKHLADVKALFASKPEYEVTYLQDGHSAIKFLNENFGKLDGVITDVMMPYNDRATAEQPIGFGIAMLCRELGLPCVMCTAGYHHGSRYQWICDLAENLPLCLFDRDTDDLAEDKNARDEWYKLVDAAGEDVNPADVEYPIKDWKSSFQALVDFMSETKS